MFSAETLGAQTQFSPEIGSRCTKYTQVGSLAHKSAHSAVDATKSALRSEDPRSAHKLKITASSTAKGWPLPAVSTEARARPPGHSAARPPQSTELASSNRGRGRAASVSLNSRASAKPRTTAKSVSQTSSSPSTQAASRTLAFGKSITDKLRSLLDDTASRSNRVSINGLLLLQRGSARPKLSFVELVSLRSLASHPSGARGALPTRANLSKTSSSRGVAAWSSKVDASLRL
mmetsp:Transcript_11616/g.33177  ORF Transcript_11616/g.33177 Transcript_11616/m.33177 type:complete len:233 (-) Transcript_11616:1102-1800(-)